MSTSVTGTHQVSLTEWLAAIGEAAQSEAFRAEDISKQGRLEVLMNEIGLPYRMPVAMPALDALNLTPAFARILEERGDESVAFRLTPDDSSLEKLRNRGLTVRDCYEQWFRKLDIDFSRYTLSIFPNESVIDWSLIFVINQEAVFGEIVRGVHSQLTQGDLLEEPVQFRYDFSTWEWSSEDSEAQAEVLETLKALHVPDKEKQALLASEIKATFSHDYLIGYFESTAPQGEVEYFIDYNQTLANLIPTPGSLRRTQEPSLLRGVTASKGVATGPVRVVAHDSVSTADFPEGAILVCENTDVRYLPLMRKAGAILTDKGGMLSHAAIIARELKVPCLVGVVEGTKMLKDGERVTVDATGGRVSRA